MSYLYSWVDDLLFAIETVAKRGQQALKRRKLKVEDFVTCTGGGFKTRTGIVVAKWDFRIEEDIRIENTTFRRGKRYFSPSEIKALIEADAFPEGWHLPTTKEWQLMAADFDGDINYMSHCLCMDVAGFVPSKAAMERYNQAPENLQWVDWTGCYRCAYPEYKLWTSLPALYFSKHLQEHTCVGENGGYCIRLFKD